MTNEKALLGNPGEKSFSVVGLQQTALITKNDLMFDFVILKTVFTTHTVSVADLQRPAFPGITHRSTNRDRE